jgi:hypothetical protein
MVFTAGVVAIALTVLAVWGLGGFRQRTDRLIPTEPGTLITTGPYEFTFTEATAQNVTDYSGDKNWRVRVIGSGRTTAAKSMTPNYADNGMFVSRDPRSREVQVPTGQRFGESESFTAGAAFTPGLAPKRFQLEFTYSDAYRPSDTLRFVVFQLEFRDASLLEDGEKSWRNGLRGYQMYVPVTVLPPEDS